MICIKDVLIVSFVCCLMLVIDRCKICIILMFVRMYIDFLYICSNYMIVGCKCDGASLFWMFNS